MIWQFEYDVNWDDECNVNKDNWNNEYNNHSTKIIVLITKLRWLY